MVFPFAQVFPRLTAAEGLFLFGIKKKQNRGAAEFINTNETIENH